ncbi:hypothetical protein CDL15_Pgr017247 [Punica granatum]|uniref:Uncharacterized protein n=1 Tax=Punica granatum TaxID=22663 RepID=A0A218WSC4_PUNGR|nr:hypothetical protein CDL15_Pgr017247 [Punica granatum]
MRFRHGKAREVSQRFTRGGRAATMVAAAMVMATAMASRGGCVRGLFGLSLLRPIPPHVNRNSDSAQQLILPNKTPPNGKLLVVASGHRPPIRV